MKVGFVNIFGKPNAGKSTLLNALVGEKLAIVSRKVQTTRHRIKAILTENDYQLILSDTPGIIEPKYKLQEKMMQAVRTALEDADVALLLMDVADNWEDADRLFSGLQLRVPSVLAVNKIDTVGAERARQAVEFFSRRESYRKVLLVSALHGFDRPAFLAPILELLPEGEPYFTGDDLSDLPVKFFVGELVREKIYDLFEEEIPYHTTVLVKEYKEQKELVKISADIIVQRESQKGIILGEAGRMIRKLGTVSRMEIEKFIGRKVFLELFVKVKPKWRENELHLKEYGY